MSHIFLHVKADITFWEDAIINNERDCQLPLNKLRGLSGN